MKKNIFFVILITAISVAWNYASKEKVTVWLIGDSTVDDGSGNNDLWGWGKFFPQFFDTTKITVRNYAQGGTSARTFQTNGIWDKRINKRGMWDTVYSKLKKNDFLIIQFGLNDQGRIDDSSRARGTLRGIGEDSVQIFNVVTKKLETVHTFGWYMRRFIRLAKSKGVNVIVCSSVPKNEWKAGKLIRNEFGFCEWAINVAKQEGSYYIDLNSMIADVYDKEGQTAVTQKYHIVKDHVHTITAGAVLNASLVAKGIKGLKNCNLKNYLKK
ncbi:MAG: rhamnogalacturonan acetylesterase, partial [Bacteroidota bacterium]|nr:rhamnogalacturonan acetylesterase [Bacteroidota bacterium]MDP4228443.1 rhamnogalacturonan acetylesterase [Bacteroidota bacterium]